MPVERLYSTAYNTEGKINSSIQHYCLEIRTPSGEPYFPVNSPYNSWTTTLEEQVHDSTTHASCYTAYVLVVPNVKRYVLADLGYTLAAIRSLTGF